MVTIDIIKRVMNEEVSALREVEHRIAQNDTEYEKIVQEIINLDGHLIFMGVGKTGHIGEKLAATFASTGTPSFFIHATEAMHGDLGMIKDTDIVVLLSNSGETKETLDPIDAIHNIGAKIIALTGRRNSTLAKKSDYILEVFVEKEADHFNLAPTSSSTAALVVGDSLALTVSELKGFKDVDFAKLHPGGSLGKRLALEGKV